MRIAPRTLVLSLTAIALGGLAALGLSSDDGPAAALAVAAVATPRPDPQPTSPPVASPLDAYAEVLERPLFERARRASAVEPAAGADAGTPAVPAVALIGIILDGDVRVALLRDPGGGRPVRAMAGQRFQAWQVDEIRPDRIVLRHGETLTEIRLAKPTRPTATRAKPKPRLPAMTPDAGRPGEKPPPDKPLPGGQAAYGGGHRVSTL